MFKKGLMFWCSLQLTACATPFEQMWQGLATCQFDALYLDGDSGKSPNPLLNQYKPYKYTEGFAWYKTAQHLHGVPVSGFVIPTQGFSVHALFIDTPLANARQLVKKAYGSHFDDQRAHDLGMAPLLLRDPNNAKRSIIDCTQTESDGEQVDAELL